MANVALESGHFRRHGRFPIRLKVGLRKLPERGTRDVEAQTENLGFGGIFVVMEPALPTGTRMLVAISMVTAWEPLRIPSTVRWVREPARGVRAGMGLSFDQLTPEQVVAIYRLIAAQGFDSE